MRILPGQLEELLFFAKPSRLTGQVFGDLDGGIVANSCGIVLSYSCTVFTLGLNPQSLDSAPRLFTQKVTGLQFIMFRVVRGRRPKIGDQQQNPPVFRKRYHQLSQEQYICK